MIEVTVNEKSIILKSRKQIEKTLIKTLNDEKFRKEYQERIEAWLKDYHAYVDINDTMCIFSREYTEVNINPAGLEHTIATLQQAQIKFIDFLEDIVKEYNTCKKECVVDKPKNNTEEEEKFLHIKFTEKGYAVTGNIDLELAIGRLIKATINKIINNEKDQNNKNNQPYNQQPSASSAS